jgi:large subunit ribosomal protein L35
MPKMKTKRAASKRFTVTGTGKLVRRRANKRHILTKMSTKRKRQLRGGVIMFQGDVKVVAPLLPYRAKM